MSHRKNIRRIRRRKLSGNKLYFSEPVVSGQFQYYYGRDQLKDTYPDRYDDNYSYYNFPESRRDFYNKDFGRESFNVPDYYRENPFATAFAERYPSVGKMRKRDYRAVIIPKSRLANEHQGLQRYRDSMDTSIYENILDDIQHENEMPDAVNTNNHAIEFFGRSGGGFSRFGKYDDGKDETFEQEGSGRRFGKFKFGRSGKRIFRKRK
jgi:hypothetical protein